MVCSRSFAVLCVSFVLVACTAFPEDGEDTDGGEGGGMAGAPSNGGSDEGGGGAAPNGGAPPEGGSGEGGSSPSGFFSCEGVPDGFFAVKVRADAVTQSRAVRLVGSIDRPPGSGTDQPWGVLGTGSYGEEEVSFDFSTMDLGSVAAGARLEVTLGVTYEGVPAGDNDGIADGEYYCSNWMSPAYCTVDILGCFGEKDLGSYVDGEAQGGFVFAGANPVFTAQ